MGAAGFHVFVLFGGRSLLIPLLDGISAQSDYNFFHAFYH
jgi:hypothetical protein